MGCGEGEGTGVVEWASGGLEIEEIDRRRCGPEAEAGGRVARHGESRGWGVGVDGVKRGA